MAFDIHAESHRGSRAGSRNGAVVSALFVVIFSLGTATAGVRDRLLVKGLQDLEFHSTDSGSLLLSRNDGDPAGAALLRLWVAAELAPGLQAIVLGRLEGGDASDAGETHGSLDQALLRYVFPGKANILIDAGKVGAPFGDFSDRYLSNVNPLIAGPDSYDVSYPTGIVLTGRMSSFDYRVAVLDEPLANEEYVPGSDSALRPGFGIGVSPIIGLRFGGYYTAGPYLGRDVEPMLPSGADWKDFAQEIAGFELEFSRGHFELHGDIAHSSYEVPTVSEEARGLAWFVEPKYTWTPRLYTALRIQRNDYPFIKPLASDSWIVANADFIDVEVGAGWRFTRDLLLKMSYRQDHWGVASDPGETSISSAHSEDGEIAVFPDGHAFTVQLSYGFDPVSWFNRPR